MPYNVYYGLGRLTTRQKITKEHGDDDDYDDGDDDDDNERR